MPSTPEYTLIKMTIADVLTAAGWSVGSDFDMAHTCFVAGKDYETAVGTKTATISLEPRSEGAVQVVGLYTSEGRNVLATTWFTIPAGTSNEVIVTGMASYIAKVDIEVDDSYARRLHIRYPKQA